MDLVSFNMQRAREFGVPGFNEFRKFCGLHVAEHFEDLFGSMPNETVRRYQSIFEHPLDIDLWSGGVSEKSLPGSMLGPVFACIIATQFSYLRRGDRFWYELPNQPSSFTPDQLQEIRKIKLSRVMVSSRATFSKCLNSMSFAFFQPPSTAFKLKNKLMSACLNELKI